MTPGTVALVGAGPGDPDLLTQKAARLLTEADIVLHDDLVPETILQLARSSALLISVGKRCGAKRATQAETNRMMVAAAENGLRVVRLKSGDPCLFGRAAEEIEALEVAEVPFEIVPGVSAAFGAAAALATSLTDRRHASRVVFSTAHGAEENLPLDAEAHARSATHVIYMPGRDLSRVAADLLARGEPASLPCAVLSHAAQPQQSIQFTTLTTLHTIIPGPTPVVVVAGWTLQARMDRLEQNTPGALADARCRPTTR